MSYVMYGPFQRMIESQAIDIRTDQSVGVLRVARSAIAIRRKLEVSMEKASTPDINGTDLVTSKYDVHDALITAVGECEAS